MTPSTFKVLSEVILGKPFKVKLLAQSEIENSSDRIYTIYSIHEFET